MEDAGGVTAVSPPPFSSLLSRGWKAPWKALGNGIGNGLERLRSAKLTDRVPGLDEIDHCACLLTDAEASLFMMRCTVARLMPSC